MDFLEFTTSTLFLRLGAGFALFSLFAAIGFLLYALRSYDRVGENPYSKDKTAPWGLLFGTWKDSLIITVLFMSEGFLFRMETFTGWNLLTVGDFWAFSSVISPIAATFIYLVISYIAIVRIARINTWLKSEKAS